MKIRVALLQLDACVANQTERLTKGESFCRRAAELGADIALFPEMWNIGYTFFDPTQPGAQEKWQARALGLDDLFVTQFKNLAHELNLAIALTYLERWPGAPRNTVSLIDRHGEIVLTYAKVHTCDFDIEAALTPGDDFSVYELDTAQGTVRVGAMICYDREFPESARILMLKGAELILTPNACELEINRMSQIRARAFENMVAIAVANYAGAEHQGHSVVFDGMAFTANGISRDMCLVETDEKEGIYLAELDIAALRAYRTRETWGNAFRKRSCYSILTATEVREPFIRKEARP